MKAARLLKQGYSQAEVARRVGVHRTSISRWAKELAGGGRESLKRAGVAWRKLCPEDRQPPYPIPIWVIQDEWHCEMQIGRYYSLAEALTELARRAALPWNKEPNRCPCSEWQACGRGYEILKVDASVTPWKLLRRVAVLEVSAKGVRWLTARQGDRRARTAAKS